MSFFSNNSIRQGDEDTRTGCTGRPNLLFFIHSKKKFLFFFVVCPPPPNRDRNHCGNMQEEPDCFDFYISKYYKKWCIFISNMHIAYKYYITNEVVAHTLKNVDFFRSKVDVF